MIVFDSKAVLNIIVRLKFIFELNNIALNISSVFKNIKL